MAGVTSMQEFIARENIARFEAKLRATTDDGERRVLHQLIRQEEERLAASRREHQKARTVASHTDKETTPR